MFIMYEDESLNCFKLSFYVEKIFFKKFTPTPLF